MKTVRQRHPTALVTGASSGLGAAFVAMLLAEGVRVWGTARAIERLPVQEGFAPLVMDLADPDSVEAAWRQAEDQSGGISLLVNNAGGGAFGRFADLEPEAWKAQFQLLVHGPARLSRLALGAMRARGRGCIVNVSSLAVEFPIPFMAGYSAAKAALSALSITLGLEAAADGISVLDFRPGDYRTNFNDAMTNMQGGSKREPAMARVWDRMERECAAGPAPARAARDLRRALLRGRSGTVRSGSFFQAVLASRFSPLLPEFVRSRLHRRHFGIG